MAFTPIDPLWIVPGAPTKSELFERISDNLDDLESRLTTVEVVSNVIQSLDFELVGDYTYYSAVRPPVSPATGATLDLKVGITYARMPIAITALACRLIHYKAGKTGTASFDILYSTNNGGSFASIFSTLPTAPYTGGYFYIDSSSVLAVTSFPANTIFRLDLVSFQDFLPWNSKTVISLEYEVT